MIRSPIPHRETAGAPIRQADQREKLMSKGERRTGREDRKPKKPAPPKQNASNPSLKGTPQTPATKKG